MTAHVPAPWVAAKVATDSGWTIEAMNGKAAIADLIPYYDEDSPYTAEANAAFIVRAVNSYDKMKAALTSASELLQESLRDIVDNDSADAIDAVLMDIQAALKSTEV